MLGGLRVPDGYRIPSFFPTSQAPTDTRVNSEHGEHVQTTQLHLDGSKAYGCAICVLLMQLQSPRILVVVY